MAGKLTQQELTLLYLQILEGFEIKKGSRNAEDIDRLVGGQGWLNPTGRKDSYKVTDLGRISIPRYLDKRRPDWRELLSELKEDGRKISMKDLKALESSKKLKGMVRREFLNRKTAAACYGYDSKAGLSKLVRQHLGDTHITTDQVLRVRSNLGLILKMRDGREFQPDCQGEVFLSERTFLNKFAVGGLMPKVIFSTENLGSYIDFPDFSRDLLLIYTPGDDTVLTEKFLQLLPHSCPHFHFGDLDARGQAIARRLSLNCPQPMRIFAPEFWGEFATTFLTLEKVWPEDAHEIESPIIEGLKREGQWLEQEGIALDPRLDRAIRDVIDNAIVFAE